MDWRHKAVCRDEDPELFFPVGNSGPALAQIADAKLVCNRCPVTTECLSWALESGQDAGVWGGASEDDADQPRHLEELALRLGVADRRDGGGRAGSGGLAGAAPAAAGAPFCQ